MDIKKFNFKNSEKYIRIVSNNIKMREKTAYSTKIPVIKTLCELEIELFQLELQCTLGLPVLYRYLKKKFYNYNVLLLEQQVEYQTQRVEILSDIYHLFKTELKNLISSDDFSSLEIDFQNSMKKYNRNLVNAYNRLNNLKQELAYENRK